MKCPFCNQMESKVVDSRPANEGASIRRRRECLECHKRFTTYEIIETIPIMVVKRDKSRQPFDSEKLLGRLMRACGKRPVSIETLEKLVLDIQNTYANQMRKEINSTELGELVMERLKEVDQVAYVRFASVYKEFKDIDTFMDELKSLKSTSK